MFARLNNLRRFDKADQFLVRALVPIPRKAGEAPALVVALEAEPAFGIIAEVVFCGRFGMDGGLIDRPYLPGDPVLVDHVPNRHQPPSGCSHPMQWPCLT